MQPYKLCKLISVKVIYLLYIDDLKIFVSSESVLQNQPSVRWSMSEFSGTPKSVQSLMYRGGCIPIPMMPWGYGEIRVSVFLTSKRAVSTCSWVS